MSNTLTSSDWLTLAGICVDIMSILISSYIAYWVVGVIQNKMERASKLRDYFATELIELKKGYSNLIQEVCMANFTMGTFRPQMQSLGVRTTSLTNNLNSKYHLTNKIIQKHSALYQTISFTPEFEKSMDGNIALTDTVKSEIRKLEQEMINEFDTSLMKLYEEKD
jgi:hypothetical protein